MKTIIAGSRNAKLNMSRLMEIISSSEIAISEVVSGHSGNVDLIGEQWARGMKLPIKLFPADWKDMGKAAGPFRNRLMAKYADALIAIWDGQSRGTMNMIDEAHNRKLKVYVGRV